MSILSGPGRPLYEAPPWRPFSTETNSNEDDPMLTLQIIETGFNLHNGALFSLKAEVLLRMAGLEYTLEGARPDKAPKGKLPVLIDGDRIVPDSSHIQAHLETAHHADFDGSLTAAQRAEAMAYRVLLEEHLYFVQLYSLWFDEAELFRDGSFSKIPGLIRKVVFNSLQKSVKRQLHAQGIGRHSRQEIFAFGVADLSALEARLEHTTFFFGDKPTSVDATVYATLHGMLRGPFRNPMVEFALNSDVLKAYEARMHQHVFGDAPDATVRVAA